MQARESECRPTAGEEGGERKPDAVSSFYEWIDAAVFSLVVVVLVFTFLCRIMGVDGSSMKTTLMDRDLLILSVLPYTPERGDIVVVGRDAQEPLVKRVIGVAGDTVEIDEEQHRVRINGVLLDEPYIHVPTYPEGMAGKTVEIPDGKVFVLGDNRVASLDSRSIGLIDEGDILGKAVFRILPFDRIGSIYEES